MRGGMYIVNIHETAWSVHMGAPRGIRKNRRTSVRLFLYKYSIYSQVSSRLSQLRNAWALMVLVTGMTVFAPQREQLTHMPSSVTSTV